MGNHPQCSLCNSGSNNLPVVFSNKRKRTRVPADVAVYSVIVPFLYSRSGRSRCFADAGHADAAEDGMLYTDTVCVSTRRKRKLSILAYQASQVIAGGGENEIL